MPTENTLQFYYKVEVDKGEVNFSGLIGTARQSLFVCLFVCLFEASKLEIRQIHKKTVYAHRKHTTILLQT